MISGSPSPRNVGDLGVSALFVHSLGVSNPGADVIVGSKHGCELTSTVAPRFAVTLRRARSCVLEPMG